MSEYQYYEFQSVDRALTEKEIKQVTMMSSRVELSPHRAVFVYNYGDFRHDPVKVLGKYFDAMVYVANWGSRWLYFRLPTDLVSLEELSPYCDGDTITVSTAGNQLIVGFCFDEEGSGAWVDGDGWLSALLPLREQILEGDYRCLYLGWLKSNEYEDDDDERMEPTVPSGLEALPKSIEQFVEFFDIDPDLIAVAAEGSKDVANGAGTDWMKWIAKLSKSEKEEFLVRLAEGESTVGRQLRSRLKEISRKQMSTRSSVPPTHRRRVSEILERKTALGNERTDRERRALKATHARKMKTLATQEADLWREVSQLIDQKKIKAYDEAVRILKELFVLADYRGDSEIFRARVQKLRERYPSLSGLRWRLSRAGLLPKTS